MKPKRNPPQTKPKTGLRPLDFAFTDNSGKLFELTEKQHNFCLVYLKTYGNKTQAVVDAGYDVYLRDKRGNSTETVNVKLAREIAGENLKKPAIVAYISTQLSKYGFDDENVELQHLFLINQLEDLSTKRSAIDMYYKVKDKYPTQRVDVHNIDTIEITSYSDGEVENGRIEGNNDDTLDN